MARVALNVQTIGFDANEKPCIIAHFICDSQADLPAINSYADNTLLVGCTAHCITEHTDHELKSGGVWVQTLQIPADYDLLLNRPQINGHILTANQTGTDLGLQNTLIFDSTPTQDSTNPVTSGGIWTVVKNITPTIIKDQITSVGTSYTLISSLMQTTISGKLCKISAIIAYRNYRPRGIVLSYSNDSSDFDTGDKLIAKTENDGNTYELSTSAIIARNNVPVYVWAKAATAGAERIYSIMEQLGDL